MTMIESYLKSGKIVSKIRSDASKMIVDGALAIDIVEYVEGEIIKSRRMVDFRL